jgi:3,4-dihydroxy 2-butanone 4-phosphate synthase/GTP cyclohydrolase II
VRELARVPLPTVHGDFTALAFTAGEDPTEHLALVHGRLAVRDVVVRVHSECLTGDVLGSLRCDCGEQLDRGLAAVVAAGSGVVVYLRGHEGRGIGLAQKLRAYRLQERGLDTVEANVALGLPVDSRDYGPAAGVLWHLGVRSVRLLTNNLGKLAALAAGGIECAALLPMPSTVTVHNQRYLETKVQLLGHAGLRTAALSDAAGCGDRQVHSPRRGLAQNAGGVLQGDEAVVTVSILEKAGT